LEKPKTEIEKKLEEEEEILKAHAQTKNQLASALELAQGIVYTESMKTR